MTDHDRKLRELLGPPGRGADLAFVNRIEQLVVLEQRLRRARRLAWRKFAKDVLASGVVLGVLMAMVSIGKSGVAGGLGPAMSPATFALFVFVIWASAALKPSSYSSA